jgi:hypothetical protein
MSAALPPLPGQPLPLRMLLDRAVSVSRENFSRIFPPVAIPLALMSGAFPLLQALFMGRMQAAGDAPGRFVPLIVAMVIGAAVLLVVYLFANATLYVAAVDAAAGRAVSMRSAWARAIQPSFWGTALLSYIAFFGGLVCCILPGVYVGLLFSLGAAVIVEEGLSGPKALARSAELIRYNPQKDFGADPRGKAFLIVFVGMLMSYALSLLVQLPFIVAQQVYVFRYAAGARSDPAAMMMILAWFEVPANLLGALVQTAVQIYIAVGLALLYFDIRGRKEGLDIEAAVSRIEGPTLAGGPAE